jgi:ammonia channel protein AmtB
MPSWLHGVAGLGAVDFSGGYVIHVVDRVSGVVAAMVIDIIVYPGTGKTATFSVTGLLFGHPRQFVARRPSRCCSSWSGVATYVICKVIALFVNLRLSDADPEIGDLACTAAY